MAPENASLPKRKPKEGQYLFDLGVRGRKTGLTLPDTGVRDEHGLEPMDHLFSSPEKPKTRPLKHMNGNGKNANATLSSEQDMDVADSTAPEPTEVIAERKRVGIRLPPPRSKSPIKTFLKSPARRNPSMGLSSPVRGPELVARAASTSAPVRRKLDFSNNSFENGEDESESHTSPQKRGGSAMPSISTAKTAPGERLRSRLGNASSEADNSIQDEYTMLAEDDDFQLLDAGGDEDMEVMDQEPLQEPEKGPEVDGDADEVSEVEEEHVPIHKAKAKEQPVEIKRAAAKRGRPKKQNQPVVPDVEEEVPESPVIEEVLEPVKKKGRPKKLPPAPVLEQEEEEEEEEAVEASSTAPSPTVVKATKRQPKNSKRVVEEEEEDDVRPAKRSRLSHDPAQATGAKSKANNVPNKIGPKPKGRKPKLGTIAESTSPLVVRGPPIPRNKPGLFIFRRETPMEGTGFKQTRSGRNSIKPVEYWRGEKIEYNTDATEDPFGKKNFLMPTIKEVVRTDMIEVPKRARAKSRAPKNKKRAESESEDEAELEPWEHEPGIITGEIRVWDPVDQIGSQSEEVDADIAFSAAAIVTTQIPQATFRFAKTLTLPFFGSGMVDLPPGGVKKQKNSRKMQMVFFVHRGRVQVTVNDTAFRIGQGGMWQVPRGNFYSIENDYDKEARIFFSQGCELFEEVIEN